MHRIVIDPQYDDWLMEALHHLMEAKSFINLISRSIGDFDNGSKRPVQEELQRITKRISSAHMGLEKLA
jgi:hypothetical protein